MTSKSIIIIDYPGVQKSAALGLEDLFLIANINSKKQDGVTFHTTFSSDIDLNNTGQLRSDAFILPPSLSGARGNNRSDLHQFIQDQHSKGAIACSVCAGAFWLGHSNLLNGRPTTTHWALAEELQHTFPDSDVNAEHILIDDHDIVTAGGLMAWLDLGLFLVGKWQGPQNVTQTARHLLIDPNGRDQRNYRSFQPVLTHGDQKVLKIQHWLEGHSDQNITVKKLAEHSQLSDRTFLRRFKAATGLTPNTYLQNLRIEKARGLLERSRIPINEISWKVGYNDPSAFSRIFKERTGLNAGEYRNRFGLVRHIKEI